jgi:hypothetical protein
MENTMGHLAEYPRPRNILSMEHIILHSYSADGDSCARRLPESIRKCSNNSAWICAILLAVLAMHSNAIGQVSEAANKKPKPFTNRVLKVYRLKYAKSEFVANFIPRHIAFSLGKEDAGGVQVISEPRTNSVFIEGSDEDHAIAGSVISEIDSPIESDGDNLISEIVKFGLDSPLLKNNGKLIRDITEQSRVGIAFESSIGLVILRGPQNDVKAIQNFLSEVEKTAQTEPVQKSNSKLLRFVWLASNANATDLKPLDPSMSDIAKKLERLDIRDVRVVGQLLTRSKIDADQSKFQSGGQVSLMTRPLKFNVNGRIQSTKSVGADIANTDIRIDVSDIAEDKLLSSIGVDVVLEMNKTVILASTPIDGKQMVFLVQMLDAE